MNKSGDACNTGSHSDLSPDQDMDIENAIPHADIIYKTVFDNAAVGIIVADCNENIIYWNKFTEHLLGMNSKDLYMKSIGSLYPESEWVTIRGLDIRDKGSYNLHETKVFHKNGELVDVGLSVAVIKSDNGKVTSSIGIFTDIRERKKIEKQLQLSEEKYRIIFENSVAAITVTDQNEHIVFWNKRTEDLLRMDSNDLFLKPVKTLYPEEEWNLLRSLNIREKGLQHLIETKVLDKAGELIDVGLSVSVLKSPDGEITGSIGMIVDRRELIEFKKAQEEQMILLAAYEEQSQILSQASLHDIHAREQAEHELSYIEGLYSTVFENSVVGITLTDENENIIFWNKYTEQLLGMEYDDLYLKPVHTLYPEEEWKMIRKQDIRQKGMQHNIETKMITKDKDILDVSLSVSVLRNPDGKITGSIGMFTNITERKITEAQLRIAEERYRTIFDNSAVAIMLTDENENIVFWNSYTEQLLNMGHNDLYMKPVSELYPADEWNMIRAQNIRAKGLQQHIETKMVNKDQELIDIGLSVTVLKNPDGRITGSIGMVTDLREITELRKLYSANGVEYSTW